MSFVNIGKLVKKSVKDSGIQDNINVIEVLESFDKVMTDLFGEDILKKIKALEIKDGVLDIACLSSVLAERLKKQERRIIHKLNQPYKEKVVEKLKFSV